MEILQRRCPGRNGESAERGTGAIGLLQDGNDPRQPLRGNEVIGEPEIDRVRRSDARAGETKVKAELSGAAGEEVDAPISGKSPMRHSGIAICVVSLTMRCDP